MLSNTLLRTTGRRLASSAKRAASSSTSQAAAFNQQSDSGARAVLPVMAAAAAAGFGLTTLSREDAGNTNDATVAQCWGKTGPTAKELEDKFATYWPRNIMILFGPPGE